MSDSAALPLEEIVVTALKRDTKLQDTPISITALTADTLSKKGVTNFNEYYRSVPSLQVTENAAGQSRISIRGIYLPGESTVGIYYDETPVTGPSGTTADPGLQTPNIHLFDVSRVEVLRGPQGTLYGSGSMGGTLKVIFNKPDASDDEGRVEAQLASTEHGDPSYMLNGAANLPLIRDELAVRMVGYTKQNGGYVDNVRTGKNDVNEALTHGGRLMLRYTPTPDVELLGTVLYQKNEFDDNPTWYAQFGDYKSDQPMRQWVEDDMQLFSGTLNWSMPFAKLTVSSSYYDWDLTRVVDITPSVSAAIASAQPGSPLCRAYNNTTSNCTPSQLASYQAFALSTLPGAFMAPLTVKSQTHEIRLTSPGAGAFDWTVGLFYEDRSDHTDSRVVKGDATGEFLDPLVITGRRFIDTDVKQFAQFGEVSVRPFEGWTVTGGIRHYNYDKGVSGVVQTPSLVLGFFPGPRSEVDASADGWVGKANISYQLTDGVMGYVQWAQGFRPGGANNVPALNQSLVAYKSDKLESYELGLKSSFYGGRYIWNVAAFDIELSDMQAALFVQPGFAVITNAGDGRIRGFETELSARFGGLTLSGGGTYLPTAKLTSAQAGGAIIVGAQNGQTGDHFPYTAEWSGTAAAEYGWQMGQASDMFARLDANYRGKQNNEFRPTYAFYEKLDDFVELNGRIGFTRDQWTTSLFVNNITNVKEPIMIRSNFAAPPYQFDQQQITPRPRTFGVNFATSF